MAGGNPAAANPFAPPIRPEWSAYFIGGHSAPTLENAISLLLETVSTPATQNLTACSQEADGGRTGNPNPNPNP